MHSSNFVILFHRQSFALYGNRKDYSYIIIIVQQGMNHDRLYFPNIFGVNMLIYLWPIIIYIAFYKQDIIGYKSIIMVFVLDFCGFLLVAGGNLIEIH